MLVYIEGGNGYGGCIMSVRLRMIWVITISQRPPFLLVAKAWNSSDYTHLGNQRC